jgi:ABC-type transport system involved in multi-copper enzyme maturation permease subunit
MVLLVAPHAVVAILFLRGTIIQQDQGEAFMISSVYSIALLQLAFALLGGNSIAGERIDRSAEFLACLPVSRGRNLVSKLLVALAMVPLVWLPNLVVLAIAGTFARPSFNFDFPSALGTIAVTGLAFFCVAWLFSCMLESPTFSVSAGLIAPLLVVTGVLWVGYLLNFEDAGGFVVHDWYVGLCLAISAASFPTGTVCSLRRVEP